MTNLPEINGFNALIAVDNMGKSLQLGTCRAGENQFTAPQIAKLSFENWALFFGVPKSVIHNRDVCFTASLWKVL